MVTIHEVAASLGLTERAVRLRIDALGGMLDAYLRRGPNNELIFTGEAIAILQRLEELRKTSGVSVRQAAAMVRQELEANPGSMVRQTGANQKGEVEVLRELIDELKRERDHWRELALKLQEQLLEAQKPALPSPRERRPWWARGIFKWLWP